MEEIWKDTLEKNYQVSNYGNIKSIMRKCKTKWGFRIVPEKILQPFNSHDDYLRVTLNKKHYFVHRLVAEAFLEIPEELKQYIGTPYLHINHKDENPSNNNVNNLEWCTAKYNNNYGTRNERIIKNRDMSKYSKPVLQYTLDGEFVKEWKSIRETDKYGFYSSNVSACCKGKQKYHKGIIWKLKDEQ